LTGEMKDQLRIVKAWDKVTGTLTVERRFVNPDVSLLFADVGAGDTMIPVVDASVFVAGEAYIWDALNAETVTITVVDTALNQITIAPGLANAYTLLAGAAISMSPRILLGTQFLIECGQKVRGRLPDGSLDVSPSKVEIAPFDSLTGVAGSADVANMVLSTNHRGPGTHSIEFDKTGVTQAFANLGYTLPQAIDIGVYSAHAKLMWFGFIPTPVGTIIGMYVSIGDALGNTYYWEIPVADITFDAWRLYEHLMSEV
ncbi:unnamed protein product, partial [marine sediment metagenome]